MDIVPAILEITSEDLINSLNKVSSFAKRVHVDFNDGSFGSFVSVKLEDLRELPNDINFEAHLMVQQPSRPELIKRLRDLGFRKIVVQWEIEGNIRDTVEQLMEEEVLVGVAVAPETPISDLEPVLELLDFVTVMTVVPGRQGQVFLPENLEKVKQLHEANFFGEIEVDGGINGENIRNALSYGPDTLIVGSYIVKARDPREAYEELVKLV